METRHFQKVVLSMNLFLSLQSFTFSLVLHLCLLCSTRVLLVFFVQHSCHTRVALMLLVSPRVALVPLVLHWCCTLVAHVWHSYCKLDEIKRKSPLKRSLFSAYLRKNRSLRQENVLFTFSSKYFSFLRQTILQMIFWKCLFHKISNQNKQQKTCF